MKAICVTSERTLEVREVLFPGAAPSPGHLYVDIDSSAITHGDKFFLTRPLPGGGAPSTSGQNVYGANASGRVTEIGEGVPRRYLNKQVAIYKSLTRSDASIGIWSERAQLPYTTCLILPDELRMRDYCGSFANALTVYAFLAEVRAGGHRGIIVTAGMSATGRIAASMTQEFGIPAIFLVRSEQSRNELVRLGVKHALSTTDPGFDTELTRLAAELQTTAVFDGVGGELLTRILPSLPMNSTIFVYGFLGATHPASFSSMLLMGKNTTIRRFSNLQSSIVTDPIALSTASKAIEELICNPLYATNVGKEFQFSDIQNALSYEGTSGRRAILVP